MNIGDVSFLFSTMDDVFVIIIHPQRVGGNALSYINVSFRLLQFYTKEKKVRGDLVRFFVALLRVLG